MDEISLHTVIGPQLNRWDVAHNWVNKCSRGVREEGEYSFKTSVLPEAYLGKMERILIPKEFPLFSRDTAAEVKVTYLAHFKVLKADDGHYYPLLFCTVAQA